MATIGTASHSSYLNTPRRSYITTAIFKNDIYQYTTSVDPNTFQVNGTLTSLGSLGTGTDANCPANRILVENGKKLYPSGLAVANNQTYGAPNPGVTTYMVGVYDPASFLSGFIDPNSQTFAPYNTDKPNYVPRGINPTGGAIDQGPPVYTLGSVTAGTTITAGTGLTVTSGGATVTAGGLTVTAGGIVATAGGIVATAGQIRANTLTTLATATPSSLNAALGQLFTITPANDVTINATNVSAGSVVYLRVVTSGTTAYTITFGTNFKSTGTLSTGATTARTFMVTFVSDGTNLNEIARTTAMA